MATNYYSVDSAVAASTYGAFSPIDFSTYIYGDSSSAISSTTSVTEILSSALPSSSSASATATDSTSIFISTTYDTLLISSSTDSYSSYTDYSEIYTEDATQTTSISDSTSPIDTFTSLAPWPSVGSPESTQTTSTLVITPPIDTTSSAYTTTSSDTPTSTSSSSCETDDSQPTSSSSSTSSIDTISSQTITSDDLTTSSTTDGMTTSTTAVVLQATTIEISVTIIEATITTTETSATTETSVTTEISVSTVNLTSSTSTVSLEALQTATSFSFLQIDGDQLNVYPSYIVDGANFSAICPCGNCLESCSDYSLLLNKGSYDLDYTPSSNTSSTANDITLFSVCSNIGNVTGAVSAGSMPEAAKYFPKAQVSNVVQAITLNTTSCLFDTCQATRDPEQCWSECEPGSLLTSATTMNITQVAICMYMMCSNTCGLPDANQDVFGIGVLVSYVMQAILVMVCALVILGLISNHLFRGRSEKLELEKKWKDGLTVFLAAQCYFGISSVIASYSMGPRTLNPLDGYALLSVAITAFMPPIFTLMLLQSIGIRSRFSTGLVTTSWLFSSILFFMLLGNLSTVTNNPKRLAEARNSLFKVDSCGGYSAMSLCQENIHTDPLRYLAVFYNKQSFPSINTVILLWLWSTGVLLILQLTHITTSSLPNSRRSRRRRFGNLIGRFYHRLVTPTIKLAMLSTASIIFGLAFGYQAQMVVEYFQMDVVDRYNWSFGQWVAVLFWIPPIIDFLRRSVHKEKKDSTTHGTPKMVYQSNTKYGNVSSTTTYQPVPVTPLTDHVSKYEPLRYPMSYFSGNDDNSERSSYTDASSM